MKNGIYLLIMALIIFPALLLAQGLTLKAAMNFSKATGDDLETVNYLSGGRFGASYAFEVNEKLLITPGIFYTQKGWTSEAKEDLIEGLTLETKNRLNLNYLEIPVHLEAKLPKGFRIQGGPYLAFLLDENTNFQFRQCINSQCVGAEESWDPEMNESDLGLNLGLSKVIFRSMQIFGNYQLGLTDISPGESKVKLRSFHFGIGYMFNH